MKKSRRFLATVLIIVMVVGMIPFYASAEMQPGVIGLSRRAAAEGIVMLQNDNDVLPLDSSRTVSVFGRVQYNYFYCGYGSGGDVKYPYSTNLLDGMRRNPGITVNETLARTYESWCKANVPSDGFWGNWPTHYPEMPLNDEQVSGAADVSDTAVVVIGRSAGEDRESTLTKGSYYLTDLEVEMLDKVTAAFDEIVVVLDVGNIIDMGWVDDYPEIDSILYAWQGGMESGPAVADVLSGDESPSGKLAATIAYEYADYPSSANFGNEVYTNYAEDIFVGYRYFETFAQDKVRYGFGYGLSYTDFDIETTNVAVEDGEIKIDVTVTNTGDYKGKEVVQVYYGAPQGVLGKASKSLAAYAKTNLLQPGASESIQISFKIDDMSSYDDAGKTGYKSAWVMEAGDYPIYVGNSVRDSEEVGKYTEDSLRVTEQLSEAGAVYPAENAFARWTASEVDGEIVLDKETDMTPTRTIDLKETIIENLPEEYERDGVNLGYKLIDVYEGNCTMEEFIKQMTVEDLADLTHGAGPMGHSFGIAGNAAVAGGINTTLRDTYGIPAMSYTDGPSGVRMTASATLLPIGTTLACTWNDRLVEELYAGLGAEMVLNGSDALLAPGMNLQRDPLCGRNFEYFSEDPLLTGQMGANTVRGVQSQGVSATPKHYAANNQETKRKSNDSRLSERALREIYLKGFEICVKTAKPQNIMTSYNRINSVYAHSDYQLNTVILREQWGYEGCVMTDWWISNNTDPDFGLTDNAYRVRAQVDVLMPGENYSDGDPVEAYEAGILTLGEIQRSAINVLNFALKSARFRIDNDLPLYDYEPGAPAFEVVQEVQSAPIVNAIYLDGVLLDGFHSLTNGYLFYKKDLTSFQTVTAEADAGVEIEIIQATAENPCATVYARTADGGVTIYRINWTNQAGLTPTVPNPVYAKLSNIYVNGEKLLDFYHTIYSYSAWVEDLDNVVVIADTPEGVEYSVTRDGDIVNIRAESEHQAMDYVITIYTSETPPDPVKVVDITADGISKVKIAEDQFHNTSGFYVLGCNDEDGGSCAIATNSNEYLLYNIEIKKSGYYDLNARYAASAADDDLAQLAFSVHVDGERLTTFNVRGTGGYFNWVTAAGPETVYLEEGFHKLTFYCDTGGLTLNWLTFERIVDKDALNELYNSAQGKDSSKYTEASWTPFASALAEAKAVLDDESATQDAVDAACAKLQAAIEGLAMNKEVTPKASIDYVSEQLIGLATGTYTINGETVNVSGTACAIQEKWMGKTLNIVKKGNGTTTIDSDAQTLAVPARPAAPSVSAVNETYEGRNDGKITSVTTNMEYRKSADTSWTACTGTEITGLAKGDYLIRTKAAAGSSFTSAAATVAVGSGEEKNFKDVKTSDWYYDSVQYVNAKGIMVGTSADTFEPEFKLNRATVVMVLYRMDGEPDVSYSAKFKDVPNGKWYSEAVIWAAENEIVQGYGGNIFGPEDNITREQFAAMMYRYAKYKEYDVTVPSTFDLAKYTDSGKISDWARNEMLWCVYKELITGVTDTTLEPTNTATRAQCAAIIQRYTEKIVG